VLVVVPTVTAGNRLLDVIPLLDGDHRVQVVFTAPRTEDVWHGLDAFVHACGAVVLPWAQAIRQNWDLVLCADEDHMARVRGDVLLLAHGAGLAKSRRRSRMVAGATLPSTGLDRELLVHRGRVVPAAVAVSTDAELALLGEICPEARGIGFVAGDVCLDRMLASCQLRGHYRAALGVADGEELITVSSTWSPDSTFGRHPALYERLLRETGARPRKVAAVIHPNVWAVHGPWQIRSWLARAIGLGLVVVPPERGWQAAIVASDVVIGDHGSTSVYGAALGGRMCLAAFPDDNIRHGSVADVVRRVVPRLDLRRPLAPQLAALGRVADTAGIRAAITSAPGTAAARIRTAMYRLLGLPEPGWPAPVSPVQSPVGVAA
jgi:hypothetical protein